LCAVRTDVDLLFGTQSESDGAPVGVQTVHDFQSIVVSVELSVAHLDAHLNGISDGLSGGLSIDVSFQVSAQIVGVFMKSLVHWRNNDVYGMYVLTMVDNTTLLASAFIIITIKNIESNSVKVVEAENDANNV